MHAVTGFQRFVSIGFQRNRLAATHAFIGGNHRTALRIINPLRQSIRREAAKHDRMDGADARASQHGESRFRHHWHIDAYSIASFNTAVLHGIGEAADLFMQFLIGYFFVIRWIVTLPDDSNLLTARLKMAVNTVVGGVQRAVVIPFDRDFRFLETDFLDLGVILEPGNALAVFPPEPFWILDGILVHLLIFFFIAIGLGRE